jgi:DNA (cytosine-5)-methyltransferase 1
LSIDTAGPVDLLPTPQSFDGVGSGYRSRKFSEKQDAKLLGGVVKELFDLLPTPTSRDHKGPNQRQDDTCLHGALLPTPRTTDSHGAGVHGTGGQDLRTTITLLPTPAAQDGNGGGRYSSEGHQSTLPGEARLIDTQWGKYGPAIARWEAVLGRPAPNPTEPNSRGNSRLNPEFSSWMMGWPEGWVTEVPGVSRNDQLRIIGNGVVDRAAVAALRYLLVVGEVTV